MHVKCCVCGSDDATPVGVGEDYEYCTSADAFLAVQCAVCGLVYLNPRPDASEFETIYPPNYHAFDFSEKDFGIIYKIRARLEAKRLLSWCEDLPNDARILDVGCGDGFHLNLLKKYGIKTWVLEGVDLDKRAVEMAEKSGLKIHLGTIETLDLPTASFDLAFMVQTIEHVEQPSEILAAIKNVLKSGGKLVVVTDNTDVNAANYGLSGADTGQLIRFDLNTHSVIGTATSLPGGSSSVDVTGSGVSYAGAGKAAQRDDFTASFRGGGTSAELAFQDNVTRLLWVSE